MSTSRLTKALEILELFSTEDNVVCYNIKGHPEENVTRRGGNDFSVNKKDLGSTVSNFV